MSLSTETAALIVTTWPARMPTEQKLTLLRQLKELDLPKERIDEWMKDSERR